MAKPTLPNFENCTEVALNIAIRCTPHQRSAQRLQAMKALGLGVERKVVAELYGVSPRTLCLWVKSFNDSGIDGLIEKPRSGRPPKISPAQSQAYTQLIQDPASAGEAHWTGRKFHGYLRDTVGHEVGYSTLMRWLHDAGFRLKVPQPWPDRQDEEAREAFLERVREWLADEGIDLWYLDEMGVEGDPRPRRRWILRGEKGRVPKNGDHIRMNVTGMVCPRTGQFYALEFTHSDTEVFQAFLDHANRDVTLERPRNLLICDNASWHKRKSLDWGAFEPVYLPAYSPDLNPIEKLWLVIKAEWFTDHVCRTREALIERLDQALCWAIGRAADNQRTCAIKQSL